MSVNESAAADAEGDTAATIARIEKRLVGQALSHWEVLRAGRRFPSYADYRNAPIPYGDDNIFVIRIGENEISDEIVHAGRAIAEALGRDPVGEKAMEVLPSSTEMGLSFCRAAAQMKKPIADVGNFTNANGAEVRYRSILMPLSDDQTDIDHVLAAFSFKFAT